MLVIKIQPHSFVDLITNSSTEIFTIQTNQSVQVVREIIDEMQKKYPNEYGHHLSTSMAEDYDIKSIYGLEYIDTDEVIKMLEALGYTVTENPNAPSFIILSGERGGIHPNLRQFIYDNFNVVDYDTER